MQMQGGHVKHICLDLDLDLRSTKSGSHAMWHVTLSSFKLVLNVQLMAKIKCKLGLDFCNWA